MKNLILSTKLITLFSIAMMQVACSIMPPPVTVKNYQLPVVAQDAYCKIPIFNGVLQVEPPVANQLLDSNNILVHTDKNTMTNYQGVRWSSTAPDMLLNYLVQAMQQSHCVQTVSSDRHNLTSQLSLAGELYAFQGEYHEARGEVWIHYYAYLVDSRTRNIIAAKDFSIREPISHNNMDGIVDTFGIASHKLASQIIQWLSQQSFNKQSQ